jgi:sulfite dehydrogenase (quinone) subunit SoeC
LHPAYSLIFFTTASGAGYGLLASAGALAVLGLLPGDRMLALVTLGLAFALVTAGLAASTWHLTHPERAWRAFSQWRSSWLSREGVLALASYAAAAPFAWSWVVVREPSALAGLVAAVLAVATVACTAMIYASLKPIADWNSGWTVAGYLALAAMTGLLWLTALTALFGYAAPGLAVAACAGILLAWAVKEGSWRRLVLRPAISTSGTATGLSDLGRVRLFEAPHTESNYLLREMGYRLARKHKRRLRLIARGLAFAIPLGVMLLAVLTGLRLLAVPAALAASAGVLVERWLFFAEARHTVMLYYGAEAA